MYQYLILQIDKCVRSFVSASHVIRFVDQRTGNLRNKTIKEQNVHKEMRQYGKIVSLVSIYYYYCLNRRSVIFLYWRLSILFYLILYSFLSLLSCSCLSTSNSKGKFVPYISKDSGQLNCSWNNSIVPGTSCSWNNWWTTSVR